MFQSSKCMGTVLVVDDDPIHCRFMQSMLQEQYLVECTHTVCAATAYLESTQQPPDIILLDYRMPSADGLQLLHAIKTYSKDVYIPIILITVESDSGLQEQTLELGAVDYMIKPVAPGILQRKVANHIQRHRKQKNLREHNVLLHEELAHTLEELQTVQDVTILALATLTEVRNSETGEHIWRTQEYVKVLAQALRRTPRYRGQLTDKDIYLIYKTAPLHDIGKVGIPDEILNKPGPLTSGEIEIIRTHTLIGYNALSQAERIYENRDSSFLKYAREICGSHHERWDGQGYPHGLGGEEIPLSARIMAIADVYDALVTQRSYKEAYSHEEALEFITLERGHAFDPYLVEVFLQHHLEFKAIATTSAEPPSAQNNDSPAGNLIPAPLSP